MALTMEFTDELTVVTCWCGINHAVPTNLRNHQLRQHRDGVPQNQIQDVYCPLGHSHVPAGEGEAARLRKQLERERERAARLAAQRDQNEAALRAERAAKTRIKNDRDRIKRRVEAGVCPHCNRTFKQLARHMKSKHPDCEHDAQA